MLGGVHWWEVDVHDTRVTRAGWVDVGGLVGECLAEGGFDEKDSSGCTDNFFVPEDGVGLMKSLGTNWTEYFILLPPVRLLLSPVLVAPLLFERMAFATATSVDIPVRWRR